MHDKIYEAKLRLGTKTDTGDREGKILEEKQVKFENIEEEYVKKILKTFVGKRMQTPPMYSAIKVNGKKLYEYARDGKNIEIKPREIEIYDIKLNNIDKESSNINFNVHVSKGTYIRSLCEEIAESLGEIGHMSELRRLRVRKIWYK